MTSRSVGKRWKALCIGVLVAMVLPAQVSADFRARTNQHVVATAVDGAQMEVFSTPGAGATDYFCAASQFALVRLNAHPSDRVVVVRPLASSDTRPRFDSVLFSVQPWQSPRTPNASFIADVTRAGTAYTNAFGMRWCRRSLLAQ